jgi:5-(carboxyamino)imidazole ribonucleotide synthase
VPATPHGDAVMVNLLGDLWSTSDGQSEPPWSELLATPGLALHLYGKTTARPGRKMGHFTLVGDAVGTLHERADAAFALLADRVAP